MKKKSYTTFAAIHLGSEMISMQIVEYRNMNKVKVIEQCNHRVRLGEETFKNKIIPFSMVSEICELLQISREEVERQRQKGYIRFVHRNGMTVYEITDILRLKNMLEMGGVYRKIDEKAFILEVAEKEKKETEPSIRQ